MSGQAREDGGAFEEDVDHGGDGVGDGRDVADLGVGVVQAALTEQLLEPSFARVVGCLEPQHRQVGLARVVDDLRVAGGHLRVDSLDVQLGGAPAGNPGTRRTAR
ncbi:hypothetical protein ACFXOS_22605 [Streptomyces sp. NPDC059175]|uniref:hypothetical protein n=1 Tax=Streptomyces sp. NPDC059175 TaxID=3346757 RepID=UPI00367ED16C